MAGKEKPKSHPFAGYLRPDEVLLWWHTPQPLTWQEEWYFIKTIKNSLGCLYTFFLLLNFILSKFQPKTPVLIAYGVTNQRLMTRQNNVIRGKPLNKFQIPTQIIHQGPRAMLNLGRTSWWWINIEPHEAEHALQIIEQAKKQFKNLS